MTARRQLLIKNPINRYLINSPMLPNMKKNADGSLTLYIQKEVAGRTRNPTGSLRLTARFIWSCVSIGRRRKRLRFCHPAKAPGNRQAS